VDGEKRLEHGTEPVEVECVGPVGLSFSRVVMDFEEDAVDAGGDSGTGKDRDELGRATLYAVGG
jgi:hypothetical protein